MGRAESRQMYSKILASREATYARQKAEESHRLTDTLEQAKQYLRRRGWHVFNHSVIEIGSKLVVVGRTPMKADDVIAMAERNGATLA